MHIYLTTEYTARVNPVVGIQKISGFKTEWPFACRLNGQKYKPVISPHKATICSILSTVLAESSKVFFFLIGCVDD